MRETTAALHSAHCQYVFPLLCILVFSADFAFVPMSFRAEASSPQRRGRKPGQLLPNGVPSPKAKAKSKAKAKAQGGTGGKDGKEKLDHNWRDHLTPEEDPLVPADVKRAKNRARRINAEKAIKSAKGMKWIHALFFVFYHHRHHHHHRY